MFLRKSRVQRDPLPVTMSGVKLGERALQIGAGDTRVIGLIAARTGLTGTAAIVLLNDDAAPRIQRAVTDAAALAEVRVVSAAVLPFEDASFDVIVVHDVTHTILDTDRPTRQHWLAECHRLLRTGGRIVTIERGSPVGLRALFGGSAATSNTGEAPGTEAALGSAGFAPVRVLGDREGLRFVEGFKTP